MLLVADGSPKKSDTPPCSGGLLKDFVSAAPQQSEICMKYSVFHAVFDVKFW